MSRVAYFKIGVWSALTLGALFISIGCSTSNSLVQPEQLIERGLAAPGTSVDALRRGRALAVTECTGCHRLYWPNEYSPKAWAGIVRKMAPRASLSEGQTRDLEWYYVAASQAAQLSLEEKPGMRTK